MKAIITVLFGNIKTGIVAGVSTKTGAGAEYYRYFPKPFWRNIFTMMALVSSDERRFYYFAMNLKLCLTSKSTFKAQPFLMPCTHLPWSEG